MTKHFRLITLFLTAALLSISCAKTEQVPEGLLYEVIGKTVTITGYNGSATEVRIPKSIQGLPVITIGEGAFSQCIFLTSITIPSSVITIGEDAFLGCSSLTSINIPSSITSIGDGAFYSCNSLTDIGVDTRNGVYKSVDGVLFDKNEQTIICYPSGRSGVYNIPFSVTKIENFAFAECRSLINITIPSSVTTIGEGAFRYCLSLGSITIPSSVTVIGDEAFYVCRRLANVTIPSSVTSIGVAAFFNTSLTDVTLSRGTVVGDGAFHKNVQIRYRD